MTLKMIVGNKRYSSWSMRPWLAAKASGIAFEEVMIPIYNGPEDKQRMLDVSPSGKVPALIDGDVTVWDSLAIIEYLAERFPASKLWPDNVAMRAHARAVSAEMHSGFMPFRNECGMNLGRPVGPKTLSADTQANIARIQEIWADCRARYGKAGPYLFGGFTGADAMYAPVVHRLRLYAIPVTAQTQAYMDTMMALPAFRQWTDEALAETLLIERFEQD